MPKKDVVLRYSHGKTAWFALLAYKDKVEHDLETRYDGAEDWSDEEDGVFLVGLLREINDAISSLRRQGVWQ